MHDNPIIHRPQAQKRGQRIAQGLLTAGFWILFFSLLRPLLALLGWWMGIKIFTQEMIVHGGGRLLLETLRSYGLVVLGLAAILRAWAWYNQRRFAARDKRRQTMRPVSLVTIARYHQVDPSALSLWREDRRLYVRHSEGGRVLEVQAGEPTWRPDICCVSLTQHPLPGRARRNRPQNRAAPSSPPL